MDIYKPEEVLRRYFNGLASEEEKKWLTSYVLDDKNAIVIQQVMQETWFEYSEVSEVFRAGRKDKIFEAILQADQSGKQAPSISDTHPGYSAPVHRIHFLKTSWFRYAAAIIIVLGAGAYLWTTTHKHTVDVAEQSIHRPKEGTLLILADGRKIALDSLANGIVANQNGTDIRLNNGALTYHSTGETVTETNYNTISTPKGRQFQLILPDGTKAWLNAASSVHYPTVFSGENRKVSIDGEVYFEVAPNKSKPFIVDIKGQAAVEVLGTHFNVNAYGDEPGIYTTLLEGKIKMLYGGKSELLIPGQQAIIASSQMKIIEGVNTEVITAWKNGVFPFDNLKVDEVLRQFARWYDIDVKYEGAVPDIQFSGEVKRDLDLQQALLVLQKMGLNFSTQGRQIIVAP